MGTCVIFASLAMVRPAQADGYVPAGCAPLQAMLKAVNSTVPRDLKSRLQPPQASKSCCDKPAVMLKCRTLACSDHEPGLMRYHARQCLACKPPDRARGIHSV